MTMRARCMEADRFQAFLKNMNSTMEGCCHLFCCEHVSVGGERNTLCRHAVLTPEVATLRERDAQVVICSSHEMC